MHSLDFCCVKFVSIAKLKKLEIWWWCDVAYKLDKLPRGNWKLDNDLYLHEIVCLNHDVAMVDVVTNHIFSKCNG